MRKIAFLAAAAIAVSAFGSVALAQSAPPLTSVQIIKVQSTQGLTEMISPNQLLTVADHGGASVQITVREIGYAQTTRTNKLDGVIVSNSAISDTALCGSTSSPGSCSAGQTIIGFDRVYQINGSSGGSYSTTSRNSKSPFNAITDTLGIK